MLKKVLFLLISLKIVAIAIPMESLNEYNFDVDKVITLDSPHKGTGALNMQVCLLLFCSKIRRNRFKKKSL